MAPLLAVFNFEAVTNRVRTLILGAGSLPLYGPADYSMKTVSILTVTSQRPLSKEGVSQTITPSCTDDKRGSQTPSHSTTHFISPRAFT